MCCSGQRQKKDCRTSHLTGRVQLQGVDVCELPGVAPFPQDGRDSSVGTAIRYGLDGPGNESADPSGRAA